MSQANDQNLPQLDALWTPANMAALKHERDELSKDANARFDVLQMMTRPGAEMTRTFKTEAEAKDHFERVKRIMAEYQHE